MKSNKHKWILWTDADSLIMNFNIRLEDLIDNKYNLIISRDFNNINSGQFLIKCNKANKRFLNKVYAYEECIYSGYWEQSAIIIELETNRKYEKTVKIIPQRQINSYPEELGGFSSTSTYQTGDFIIHFPSIKGSHLQNYMNEFATQVIE